MAWQCPGKDTETGIVIFMASDALDIKAGETSAST
jgi:hypothetical protein